MSILVLNAGSSSLKLGLFDDGAVALASGSVDWGADAEQAEVRVRWLAGGEPRSSRRRVGDVAAAVPIALEELRAPRCAEAREADPRRRGARDPRRGPARGAGGREAVAERAHRRAGAGGAAPPGRSRAAAQPARA